MEWQAPVGFVSTWRPTFPVLLGQVGFLDRFTVTMSRYSQSLVVEEVDVLATRFGIPPARG